TAHAILDTRPRSPWKPLGKGSARSRPYRRWPTFPKPSSRRRAVTLAAAEQRPGDPRQLVRDRRHDDVVRPACQQRVDPGPEAALPALGDGHQRPGAVHELPPQVGVAALA